MVAGISLGLGLGLGHGTPGGSLVRSFDATVPTSMTASASVQFVAANAQSLSVPSSATIQTGNVNWFMAIRFYLSTKAALRGLVGKTDNATAQEWIFYYYNTPDRMQLSLYQSNGAAQNNLQFSTFGSPPLNTWVNALFGLDSGNNQLVGACWLPGQTPVFETPVARTVTLTAGAAALVFGNVPGTSAWDGRAAAPLWFKRVGAQADAVAFDNAGLGVMPDALPAQLSNATSGWKYWETSGNRNDSIGTNHASAVNTPLRVGGPVKRQAVAGTLTTGDPVTRCADPNGTGFDWVSDAPGTLVACVQGGQPGIYFDGISQYMTCDAVGPQFAGVNKPLNWRGVIKMATVGSTGTVLSLDNLVASQGNAAFDHFGVNSTGPQWFNTRRVDGTPGASTTYSAGTPDTNAHVVDLMFDASSNVGIEVDGAPQATFGNQASATALTLAGLTIGADRRGNAPQNFGNFYFLGDSLWTTPPNWAQRQADYAAQGTKFGITMTRAGQRYFLDPAGNDANTGLSAGQAYATVPKLQTIAAAAVPGDTYSYLSGATLNGALHVQCNNAPDQPPITVNTYGGATPVTMVSGATKVNDTYTAADGTLVSARAPDTGPTGTVPFGTSPKITTNQAVGNANGDNAIVYDAGIPEAALVLDYTASTAASEAFIFIFRYVDANNYWDVQCVIATGVCQIREWVAGVPTSRGAAGSFTFVNATTYPVKVVNTKSRIWFYVNDTIFGNATCNYQTAATGAAATKFGFNLTRSAAIPAGKVDNLYVLQDMPCVWADSVGNFRMDNFHAKGMPVGGTLSGGIPWAASYLGVKGGINILSSAVFVSNHSAVQLAGPTFTNYEVEGSAYGFHVAGNNSDVWSTNRKGFTSITFGPGGKVHDVLLHGLRVQSDYLTLGVPQHGPLYLNGTVASPIQVYNVFGHPVIGEGFPYVLEGCLGGTGTNLLAHDSGQSNSLSRGGNSGFGVYGMQNWYCKVAEVYNIYDLQLVDGNAFGVGDGACSGNVFEDLNLHDLDGPGVQVGTSNVTFSTQNNVFRNVTIQNCGKRISGGNCGFSVVSLTGGLLGPNYFINFTIDDEAAGTRVMCDTTVGLGTARVANLILRRRGGGGNYDIKGVTGDIYLQTVYDRDTAFFSQWNGVNKTTLAAFQAAGVGAENYNSVNYGIVGAASLTNPGNGVTQMPTNAANASTAYDPTAGSITIGAGINLDAILGVSVMPTLDFHGNPAVVGGLRDVGAVKG